ncbi:MAG: hypothetical protein A2284_10260 [Deltaproteobacteria bacterium RIFOXYA12_FULL_61_11]|nr:MAG: hypothetical protein A2284_10260 [Deltaproteobacteria bacterium RIFOXYA12_FULL_61_11]
MFLVPYLLLLLALGCFPMIIDVNDKQKDEEDLASIPVEQDFPMDFRSGQPLGAVNGLGDLNNDQSVDLADLELFTAILAGNYTPPENERQVTLQRMDLNADSKVNYLDLLVLQEFQKGNLPLGLPLLGARFGDLDGDGQSTENDLETLRLTVAAPATAMPMARICGDLDLDGTYDAHDLQILRQHLRGTFPELPVQVAYGDLDLDDTINVDDIAVATTILDKGDRYDLAQSTLPGSVGQVRQILALDLNKNGLVGRALDPFDEYIFLDFLKQNLKTLPFRISYGDLDANGTVEAADYDLAKKVLSKEIIPATLSQLLALDVNQDYDRSGQPEKDLVINRLDVELVGLAATGDPDLFRREGRFSCRYGDLDRDHDVDAADLLLLQSHVGGTPLPDGPCALLVTDLDLDGSLSAADAALLGTAVEAGEAAEPFPGETEVRASRE